MDGRSTVSFHIAYIMCSDLRRVRVRESGGGSPGGLKGEEREGVKERERKEIGNKQ